jgi:CBS domain-containing protein
MPREAKGADAMTVASILARKGRNVLTITTDTSIEDAVQILAERRVGALVVADSMQRILGIVSERDVVRLLARAGAGSLAEPVSTIMTARVVTCTDADTINQVMERMTEGRFRHLPVVEEDRLAGIVSIGDVVKARIEQVEREAEEMRAYIAMA